MFRFSTLILVQQVQFPSLQLPLRLRIVRDVARQVEALGTPRDQILDLLHLAVGLHSDAAADEHALFRYEWKDWRMLVMRS